MASETTTPFWNRIFSFNKDVFKFSIKTKAIILSSLFTIFTILFLGLYFLFPKEEQNTTFINYIEEDIKNYSDYKIHIISKEDSKLQKENITWHKVEEKIEKIEKENYKKGNEKIIIYFDSNSANIDNISLVNARAQIINANSLKIGKITYD